MEETTGLAYQGKSRSNSTAGRSGVFFKKGGGYFPDIFRRETMPIIGIKNKAVRFPGSLQRFAQEIRLLDGNERIFSTMQNQCRSVPRGDFREDADELRVFFSGGIQQRAKPWRFLIEPLQVICS